MIERNANSVVHVVIRGARVMEQRERDAQLQKIKELTKGSLQSIWRRSGPLIEWLPFSRGYMTWVNFLLARSRQFYIPNNRRAKMMGF